ncbi:MAG: hypothetical protein IJT83_01465 [Victivallales bacterium]|nr:hypothetical protein [Victivallales bacterium]
MADLTLEDFESVDFHKCLHESWKKELEAKWNCTLEDDAHIALAMPLDELPDRTQIQVIKGEDVNTVVTLTVPSLRALFRGNANPGEIVSAPDARCQWIIELFETNWIEMVDNDIVDVPRDCEMLDYYTALRRRPDGRSLGRMHDLLWQIWCFLAANYEISVGEYTSVMARLGRSARTFQMGVSSTNMYSNLSGVYDGTLHPDEGDIIFSAKE